MQSYKSFLEIYLATQKKTRPKYKRILRQRSRSFVKQWVQGIRALFRYNNEANVRNTLNSLVEYNYIAMTIVSAAGGDTTGIVLGTGTTPVTISDYKLETKIAHGSGAGQLLYALMVFEAFEVVGSTARFRSKRQFTNNSPGTITIKEAGLYISDTTANRFCAVRDVLAAPVDLLVGQTIEVRYSFQCSV